MNPGQCSHSSFILYQLPLFCSTSFHLVSASDLLPFTTKSCWDLLLKSRQERDEGGRRGRGGDLWWFFSGTSGCFPAVCLARCHAASCPEQPRHVLPFNQSGRMNGHWTQSVVSGEEGRGGLGKTQNVQLTLRGMKTPRGRSFSLYVFDLAGFGLLGGVGWLLGEEGGELCQRRKEGKFQTLGPKERLIVQQREERS